MTPAEHLAEVEAWHRARLADLTAEDGWLHLTDRVELAPGRHLVGRDPACAVQISAGPPRLGWLELSPDGSATLDSGTGPQPLAPVPGGNPRLRVAGLLVEIMNVEGQHSLRVRDLALPVRAAFPGIPRYPVDPGWRILADWIALDRPEAVEVELVTGVRSTVQRTHAARFRHDGQVVDLLPTHWKGGQPMFVIRDATAGRETYAASRFLIGQVQGDRVVLDFNRAFNPPCAFTDFAVCPLPPRGNILPFAIRAGEKLPPQWQGAPAGAPS